MIENQLRTGNLTSSQMYRLCTFDKSGKAPGASFYTYIKEKIYEGKLKRSLDSGTYSQSMAWGKFLEKRVFDMMGLEYNMVSKKTFAHPTIPMWSGSPDMYVEDVKVSEIKCYEPKNFAHYVSALLTKDPEHIKKECPKEYWQIVSNSCILNVTKGEGVVYAPYYSEMDEIRELTMNDEYLSSVGMQPWEVRFIFEKKNYELACMPDESEFSNLNVIEFDIPMKDQMFLTKRVLEAGKLLVS